MTEIYTIWYIFNFQHFVFNTNYFQVNFSLLTCDHCVFISHWISYLFFIARFLLESKWLTRAAVSASYVRSPGRFHSMIKSFAAVHLCYPAISLSYLMCWALRKIRCTNKIKFWGLTPFYFRSPGRFHSMIKSFAAVHLCYPAISLSYLMCWALRKIRCTNKIKFWGLTPFYFRICFMIYFCLTGSCPPSFSWDENNVLPRRLVALPQNCSRLLLPCRVETVSRCGWRCAGLWQGVPSNRGKSARKACGRSVVAGTLDL